MAACTRSSGSGIDCLKFGIAVENTLAAATGTRRQRGVHFGEERLLQSGIRIALDRIGGSTGAILPEKRPGALGHRQQAHHPFVLTDDAVGPDIEVDTHRLGETAHDIEGETEPLGLYRGGCFLVVLFAVAVLFGGFRALEGPEEQRGQAGVQSSAPASAVPSTCSRAARLTTSQTFSKYSGRPTSRPATVSTAR